MADARRKPRARLLVWAAMLAAGLLLAAALWGVGRWSARAPADAPLITVEIPRGASLRAAAETLAAKGAIDSADRFLLLTRVLGDDRPVQSGSYGVPAGMGYGAILDMLQDGRTIAIKVTIPEGMPSILVAERLRAQDALDGAISVPAEGSILPDTYSFPVGSSRADAVARMQAAMTQALAELWPKRSPRTVVKTPEEAVILASIVEKETGKPSERRLVAAVYSNRLRIGMKLDADPTVIYPITKGKPLGRRIRLSELRADTGYNTYVRAGLPDGPIANPGRASIEAVLNPAETRALYFVADGSGGHVFAETLAEHNANVAKWYALRRARGEM